MTYGKVFLTKNLITGKLYVGQTVGKEKCYIGSGIYFLNAIRKYGKENFKRTDLRECNCQEDLNLWEQYFIKLYNSLSPNGYNLDLGGTGKGMRSESTKKKLSIINTGKKHTEETKRKMSESGKLKVFTEEHKRNMSEAKRGENHPLFGKHHTKEHRKKMSEANMGHVISKETKKKISEGLKRYYKTKKIKLSDMDKKILDISIKERRRIGERKARRYQIEYMR